MVYSLWSHFRTLVFMFLVFWWPQGATCQGVAGANYYVSTTGSDTNPGTTRTNAWRTIQSAVDRVTPGDSITVLSGTYTGAWIQVTGMSNAPITLASDDGAVVLLNVKNPGGKLSHDSILWLENWGGSNAVSYWTIQGFEIANSPLAGIDIRGTPTQPNSHITVLSNRVHNCASRGIFTAFTDDVLIVGNESYSNGEHGVYCSNSGDRPIVRGNRLHHNAACGLHMNGDVTAGGDGIISGGLVENNRIYRNGTGGAGINMDGVVGTRVQNNLVYASPNNSGIAMFQQNGAVPSSGNTIVHNTVIMNSNTTARCGWAVTLTAGANSNSILNNILYSYDPICGSVAGPVESVTGMVCNFNVVMDRFSSNGGDSTINLATWRSYGYDSNSIIATPAQLFESLATDDYHLKTNSPAIDKGTLGVNVLVDIEGKPRPQGSATDIGAYESAAPPGPVDSGTKLMVTYLQLHALETPHPDPLPQGARVQNIFQGESDVTPPPQYGTKCYKLRCAPRLLLRGR
jgi:parallel beta-helix repeat protein